MVKLGVTGQSAIEYLMTYGWMLLVVAITGGAMFSVVQDPGIESVSGFEGNNVRVSDFGISSENNLKFSVQNTGANKIKIDKVVLESEGENSTLVGGPEVEVANTETLTLENIVSKSNSVRSEIKIIYSEEDLKGLVASGSITGNLELENSSKYRWNSSCKHKKDIYIDLDIDGSGPINPTEVYCDDAIAYYPFVNGSTQDLSGNQYSTEPVREEVISGVSDKALNFTGGKESNQTELVLEDRLIPQMRSFCFYIKPSLIKASLLRDSGSPWEDHNFFHDNGRNNADDEYGWHIYNSSTISVGYGGEGLGKSVMKYHGMKEDEWTHLCHTIGSSKMSLYVNGQNIDQTNTHQGALNYQAKGTSPLFGRHSSGNDDADGLYGGLDEVRFYDYKISEEKIKKLNNIGGEK